MQKRKFKFTPPTTDPNESQIIKYVSIFMMTIGGANIITAIGGFFDIPTAVWYAVEFLGEADPTFALISSGILSVIVGGIEFTSGLIGYIRRKQRKKMMLCYILGALTAISIIAAFIFRVIAYADSASAWLLIELILPAVFILGAYMCEKGK